ncbi:MAG: hypothetical protein M5U12_31120 [Verrucomicrobia bacterium]|nr:hypothetical protein [Verrucomicrobiota bacterium]
MALADFDGDGDTDLVLSLAGPSQTGLRYYRNDGGNANRQLKLRLLGNRSNASGLGIRLEVASGKFRVHRTVQSLPIEIGVGPRDHLEALTARWFDLPYHIVDLPVDPKQALEVPEPILPTGSCPYLYAWDGQRFRFVTDLLGSAPVGLRVADTVFAAADPREFVALGDATTFAPHDDRYVLQITEELREVLYLDEAKLVVVDHPRTPKSIPPTSSAPARPSPGANFGPWKIGYPSATPRAWTAATAPSFSRRSTTGAFRPSPSAFRSSAGSPNLTAWCSTSVPCLPTARWCWPSPAGCASAAAWPTSRLRTIPTSRSPFRNSRSKPPLITGNP